jgi:membrane dipeptidase
LSKIQNNRNRQQVNYDSPYQKMHREDLSSRARKILSDTIVIDIHNHMMFEYAIREALGYADIFNTWYAPVLQSGKIDVIATTVGGNSPCVCNLTDDLVHGSLEQIDMLRRAEEQGASLAICTSVGEIALAAKAGKTAVILAMEGARALEGIEGEESLVMLRTFHRLGLRMVCIVGGGRTRFGDGMGEADAEAGLTSFGVKLIEEMERLGMLVDLTHMTDRTFFDALEIARKPAAVSHVGVQAVCPNPNNLSDERIRAIGRNGGVIGMEMVKTEIVWESEKEQKGSRSPITWEHVIRHIDHIAELIGTEHIGLGLDFDNFELVHNIHRAMCPGPGSIEGFYTGIPNGDHMLDAPNNLGEVWMIAEYLVRHGYSDQDCRNILGGNMLRLLHETIG